MKKKHKTWTDPRGSAALGVAAGGLGDGTTPSLGGEMADFMAGLGLAAEALRNYAEAGRVMGGGGAADEPGYAATTAQFKRGGNSSMEELAAVLREQGQRTESALRKAVEVVESTLERQAEIEDRLDELASRVNNLRNR